MSTKVDQTADPAPPKKKGRPYRPKYAQPLGIGDLTTPATTVLTDGVKRAQSPRIPKTPVFSKLTTDGDLVDIWERRILNPDSSPQEKIRIKTPGMHLRWINLSNRGRYQRARYEQGWIPVQKAELIDEKEIYGASFTSEGYTCRGEKQSEMLMKMPEAVFRKIQERRTELNKRSYEKLKDNMAQAGANYIGDKYNASEGSKAGDLASKFVGDVKFGTERVDGSELEGAE